MQATHRPLCYQPGLVADAARLTGLHSSRQPEACGHGGRAVETYVYWLQTGGQTLFVILELTADNAGIWVASQLFTVKFISQLVRGATQGFALPPPAEPLRF
jgi:hypothetical protein